MTLLTYCCEGVGSYEDAKRSESRKKQGDAVTCRELMRPCQVLGAWRWCLLVSIAAQGTHQRTMFKHEGVKAEMQAGKGQSLRKNDISESKPMNGCTRV